MTSSADLAHPLTSFPSAPCGCRGGCGCGAPSPAWGTVGLERPRFYPRQIVGPDDLGQILVYANDRFRRHNRFLHGWGIGCGLVVSPCQPAEDGTAGCRVKVSAGYALDPYGNEILVPDDVVIDLCREAPDGSLACVPTTDPWCSPIDAFRPGEPLYLAIRHTEIEVKPVRAPSGCSCSDTACENTRIRDWYELRLLTELPDHYATPCHRGRDFCATRDQCRPCPTSGWVLLASVILADDRIVELAAEAERRYLLSFSGYCVECGPTLADRSYPLIQPGMAARRFVATVSGQPDTVIPITFVDGDEQVEALISVAAADVAGRTAAELLADWERVPLFEVTSTGVPEPPRFNAGVLLANSPLTGASVIDGPNDLRVRVGLPVVAADHAARVDEIRAILDEPGFRRFSSDELGNVARLDTLDVDTLASVARANAERLREVGILTLADLRDAERLPSELTPTAAAAVNRARELLRSLGTTRSTAGRQG